MEQHSSNQQEVLAQPQETIAEAATDQIKISEAPTPAAASVPPAPVAADELLPPVTDTQSLIRELAERLGEESGQIVVHRDLSTLLERMRDGVVVQLSVSRPRFFKKLSLEDLGLKINQDLATSEEALRVITDYFRLR